VVVFDVFKVVDGRAEGGDDDGGFFALKEVDGANLDVRAAAPREVLSDEPSVSVVRRDHEDVRRRQRAALKRPRLQYHRDDLGDLPCLGFVRRRRRRP